MNKPKGSCDKLKIGTVVVLGALVTGCVGYVDDGGYYDGGAVVVQPEVTFYGGFYDRGHSRDYDRRGHESWGSAHGGRRDRR